VDDALALGLAVARPDIDLVAVSTLAGNIDVIHATENTRRVLNLVGAPDIPVHQGASRPLARTHRDASHYHGMNGLGDAELPESSAPLGPDRGPAAIIRLARQFPGELVLVAVGPMTNIAIALNVCPELPSLLKRFVIMGGAFHGPGNITPFAEFNIWVDPEAAQQVFATEFPGAIAVGLDVTHQTVLPKSNWEDAKRRKHGHARLVGQILQRTFTVREQTGFFLHDPLATAVALDPSLITTERGRVDVITSGEQDGQTVFSPDIGGNWEVANGVDADRFVSGFLASYGLIG
jgi:inosine-uridine nucleoside N-ribohydrolase